MRRKLLAVSLSAILAASMLVGCGGDTNKGSDSASTASTGTTSESTGSESAGSESEENTGSGIQYNGDEVTITYWHTHSDAEEEVLVDTIIPEFEKQYPNIHVDAVRMPYDGLMQQIITSLSSGTGPDLMRMDIIWVPQLAEMGALAAVDDLEGFADLKDDLYEGPLSTNYYNGKYYGLPLNTNCLAGVYSNAMMEQLNLTELPKTYDEVVALKDKLGEDQYLIACDGANSWAMAPLFHSLGGVYTNEDYTVASGYINGEASVNALQTIVDWYDEGIIGPCFTGGKPDAANGLYDGNYLFSYQGPWFFSNDDEENIAKVTGGLLPAGEAGSLTVNGGEDLVMFESSSKKEASWVFAMFLMNEFSQTAQAVGGGHLIPTVKSIAESDEVQAVENMDVYIEQLEGAVSRTPSPAWEKISDKLSIAFQSAVLHEDTAQSALDKIAPELDALLAGEE
ncbi:MAG: extracellular solute-binding protein [Fusicatenibacter sp.]|nr:extracellular solute-binding protein [Lachnospiraceae bacterium]MDY2938963.1 extracellular solute-binding protein [Fusicatenibacter sp.]